MNDTTYWRVWGPTNAMQAVLVKVLRAFRNRRSPWCLYAEEEDGRLHVQASASNEDWQSHRRKVNKPPQKIMNENGDVWIEQV